MSETLTQRVGRLLKEVGISDLADLDGLVKGAAGSSGVPTSLNDGDRSAQ